jgi:hypothetical protein
MLVNGRASQKGIAAKESRRGVDPGGCFLFCLGFVNSFPAHRALVRQ